MTLYVWDTAGSPLYAAATSFGIENVRALPVAWGKSMMTLRYGRGGSNLRVDGLADGSTVLVGPWIDLNPEVLAGAMSADTEYLVSERLALLGSSVHFARRQCRVLNPIWRWTGGTAIQNPAEQRQLLREAGFAVAPEIVSNHRDDLLGWGQALAGWEAEAMPGQLTGIDGLLPTEEVIDGGLPFMPRRYIARRPSHDIRLVTMLLGRAYEMPINGEPEASDPGETPTPGAGDAAATLLPGGDGERPVPIDADSDVARKGRSLAKLLDTEICEILLEGRGAEVRALAVARTLGLLSPSYQLPFMLEQLITNLSEG